MLCQCIGGVVMTVMEFIQAMMLIFCLMATGIILPVERVAGSASSENSAVSSGPGPVFVFESGR